MDDLNVVTLVARLTRDPEPRAGGNVLSMRLAFTASRKSGETWEDVPQYVDAVAFGRQAETLADLLTRGDQVAITGRLTWREWEQADGTKRQAHEIACQRVQLMAKPKGAAAPPRSDFPVTPAPVQAGQATGGDEDIPFAPSVA
jgi:single-strand DNA-binding protein